jgi:glycosyltransferase involved in cell wall biosynthesis
LAAEPAVSIVTPVLNGAAYIAATVESVLSQKYPAIEYTVVDGGSTDGTLELLEQFASPRLKVLTGRDTGAADAINKGLRASNGDIVAWLNADDFYTSPHTITAAVTALGERPDAAAVYGDGNWVDSGGAILGPYPVRDFDLRLLARECFICQPACFLRRSAVEEAGYLDAGLRTAFDYDLWIRVGKKHPLVRIQAGNPLAVSRMHRDNLTLRQRRTVFTECIATLLKHFDYVPFPWVYSYACYLMDGRDQFFEPAKPGLIKYLLSLPMGSAYNRRHLSRYWREWAARGGEPRV